MVKITSLIAALASFAAVSAAPTNTTDVVLLELPAELLPVITFKDQNGVVTGERPYTAEEIALFKNLTASGVTPSLMKRGGNDIAFFHNTWTTCTPELCLYYGDVVATYWGFPVCEAAQVTSTFQFAACYTAFMLYGNWYWMDKCDGGIRDWSTIKEGNFVGSLLTWNDRWVGNCYADRSYDEKNYCGSMWTNTQHDYQKVVRCDIA